jgi:hypothetical protein
VADQPGQPDRAPVDQRHAPAPAEHAEHRVLGGHAQVAPQGQLQPAGDRMALDCGNDRLGQGHAGRSHRTIAAFFDAVAPALRDGLEVGPGAEGAAGAGEYRDRLRVIDIECPKGLGQRLGGRAVHRVAEPRAVDGDDGDVVAVFDAEVHGDLL